MLGLADKHDISSFSVYWRNTVTSSQNNFLLLLAFDSVDTRVSDYVASMKILCHDSSILNSSNLRGRPFTHPPLML